MILRDPVHGDISFTENEKKVIDCLEIQRLRGVKQLGTAYLIYPGATHTRFEHSLGTSFLAKKIITNLKTEYKITNEIEELISIVGLVHDISHVPYGHTFEDERKIFDRHDKKGTLKKALSNGTINDVLNELGIKEKVIEILTEKQKDVGKNSQPWMGQIINDTICADLLDYLRRDSYYTGINKNYDDRIFHYFKIENGKLVLNFVKNNMERSDAWSEIIHLLRLRYFFTERVYFHHAKLSSGAMISKAVELAIKNNDLTREQLYEYNDWTLFHYLINNCSNKKNDLISTLIYNVEKRILLKRAYILSNATLASKKSRDIFIEKFNFPTNEREQVEEQIIDKLKKKTNDSSINHSSVIIHCLGSSYLREAEVLIKNKAGAIIPLNTQPLPSAEIKTIQDAYENLWKMYVFADKRYVKEVASICEEIFGKKNEYI